MKLVQGKTLREIIIEARKLIKTRQILSDQYDLKYLIEHFIKVCNGIDFAHSRGIIHRDLKPNNIMIGAFHEVYILDWGIAKSIKDKSQSNYVIGTPRYMSPEQAAGLNHKLDQRSDIYSLGLILFEIATFRSATPHAKDHKIILNNTVRGKLKNIEHYQPNKTIPYEIKAIIKKATDRNPRSRYQSVKELSEELRRFLRGDSVLAQPDSSVQSLQRWIGNNREKSLTLLLSTILISIIVLSLSFYNHHLATIKVHNHQSKLRASLTSISKKAQSINEHFIYIEGLVRTLGKLVEQRLNHPQSIKEKFYLVQDYNTPGKEPPDLKYSSEYHLKISLNWPVIISVNPINPSLKELIRSLTPLRSALKQTLIASSGKHFSQMNTSKLNQLIFKRKMPIKWAYIGLEEGLHFAYPGKGQYLPEYDPRKRPWYKKARNLNQLHWQSPFLDADGYIQVPCTIPIYDSNKKFRGVASIDMSLKYVQDNLLSMTVPGVESAQIINFEGDIIVSSTDKSNPTPQSNLTEKRSLLKKITHPELLQRIKTSQNGHILENGYLYAYNYLPSQKWIYLITAKKEAFFNNY